MNKARKGIIELEQMLDNASEDDIYRYDWCCEQLRDMVNHFGNIGLLALAVVALEYQEQFGE